MEAASSALFLFDIDGTLLRRAGPHHRQALEEACSREAGVTASTESIPVQGMLDGAILAQMLKNAGVGPRKAAELLPGIMRRAQSLYVRRCPDLRKKVCPGVRVTLRTLARRRIPVGLVTGNLSRIAWKKMEQAGLREHFRFGAFAEAAPTRGKLAAMAEAEARREGWIHRDSKVVLVGDHPNDIRAAKENGMISVAVGTGVVGMDELRTFAPDLLVEDLRALDLRSLLETR